MEEQQRPERMEKAGENMRTSVVYVSNNLNEAQMVAGLLESNNIDCYVADKHFVSLNPWPAAALGGLRVVVQEKDLKDAQALLNEYLGEGGNQGKFLGSYAVIDLDSTRIKATDTPINRLSKRFVKWYVLLTIVVFVVSVIVTSYMIARKGLPQ